MEQRQIAALIRHKYPAYAQQSDDDIMRMMKKAVIAPGAQQILGFLKAHQVSVGIISGWFQQKLTERQAATLEAAYRAAKALNETDMVLRSSQLGVPREHLGQHALNEQAHTHLMHRSHATHLATKELKDIDHEHAKELITHQTTEAIRVEEKKTELQKAVIDHDGAAKRDLAQFEAVSELHNAQEYETYIDRLIDQIADLESQPASRARDEKLAFRRKTLKAKQKEYHERFGG